MPKPKLSPPPTNLDDITDYNWKKWINEIYERVGEGPFNIQGYSVSNLPSASNYGSSGSSNPFSSLIFIRNETGGTTIAFSDGTDWRRVQDRAIVS